jgi:hypothetical protein
MVWRSSRFGSSCPYPKNLPVLRAFFVFQPVEFKRPDKVSATTGHLSAENGYFRNTFKPLMTEPQQQSEVLK